MSPLAPIIGIGLGPGDPDLMSVRSRKALEGADRLAHFCKTGRRGNARTIADTVIGADPAREIAMVYPVTIEIPVEDPAYAEALAGFYEDCVARLLDEVAAGRSVGVLCEGDPFFYGSWMHLWRRLRERVPVETIPAITAMSGAWTAAGLPITWGDDVLTVLPGTLPAAELARKLKDTDAAVVMKLGRNWPKVRGALAEAGLTSRAVYVERATMAGERVLPVTEVPDDHVAPYFSLVVVPGEGRRP
ncbi:MAG: precorrin-2 C(20)-methyltransferase [Salinarimonas sp.]